jgi:hypothetical protein
MPVPYFLHPIFCKADCEKRERHAAALIPAPYLPSYIAVPVPFFHTLFPNKKPVSVKIQSPLSVEQCATVLKNATVNDTPFGTMFVATSTIICKFSRNNFRLRQKRSYGNSFGPYFYGKLQQTETGTEISGEFRIHPFVVAFMALWFGLLILIGGMMVFTSLTQLVTGHYDHAKNGNPLVGIFGPLIMVIFGIAFVKFGKWLGRSEETKMASFLQEAFSTNKAPSAAAFIQPLPPQKISMTVPIFLFAALGLISFVSAFTGVSSYHTSASYYTSTSSNDLSHSGTAITYYHDHLGRWLAVANGIFLLFMAYGIWQRLYLIWRLGFVLIALSAVSFVFNVLADPNAFPHGSEKSLLVFTIFISVGALAVGVYWTVWWYKKKDYFTE